jgi:hypothetical protein
MYIFIDVFKLFKPDCLYCWVMNIIMDTQAIISQIKTQWFLLQPFSVMTAYFLCYLSMLSRRGYLRGKMVTFLIGVLLDWQGKRNYPKTFDEICNRGNSPLCLNLTQVVELTSTHSSYFVPVSTSLTRLPYKFLVKSTNYDPPCSMFHLWYNPAGTRRHFWS